MNVRNLLIGLVGAASLALAGCGGGFSCSDKSKCSADPAPDQASIDSCNKIVGGACGSQFKDLGSCEESNQKCTSDNKTDPSSGSACATQLSAFMSCCQSNASACQ